MLHYRNQLINIHIYTCYANAIITLFFKIKIHKCRDCNTNPVLNEYYFK